MNMDSFKKKKLSLLIAGAGGGGSSSGSSRTPVEADDTVNSRAMASILDLLGEGVIGGLINGAKSIFLNGTPLENSDGSKNYNGVTWWFRDGSQDQEIIEGFDFVETPKSVNTQLKTTNPVTTSIDNDNADRIRVIMKFPSLRNVDKKTGDTNGTSVKFKFQISNGDNAFVDVIAEDENEAIITLTAKKSSVYYRSYTLVLPKPGGLYKVRAVRITEDHNDNSYLFDDTYVDSIGEIVNTSLNYPNSALVGLKINSEQFGNSMPSRSYLIGGLKIRVPSNYDIRSNEYNGTWDGTFQIASSSNPAWILFDLLTNARYGLGEYITESMVDLGQLYQIGRYCDELVDDGFGGKEKRFSINTQITSRQDAYRVVQDIAGAFRGMVYWAGGMVHMTQDCPADPVMLFTNSNIVNGMFAYKGSARKDRPSVALITYNDKNDGYKQNVEYVEDPEAIKRFGIRKTESVAFGCTSRGQAHRVGLWTLYTARMESDLITFTCGMDAAFLMPGDLILLQDRYRAGRRNSGRITAFDTNSITLDAPISLKQAGNFISFMSAEGTIVERDILESGDVSKVTFNKGLSSKEIPVSDAVWIISQPDLVPVQTRVIKVAQGDDGVSFNITAIQNNPTKYEAIDSGATLVSQNTTVLDPTYSKPSNLNITEGTYLSSPGNLAVSLTATWEGKSAEYWISWRRSDEGYISNWQSKRVTEEQFELKGVNENGTYDFQVYAVSVGGRKTDPISATYRVLGTMTAPDAPASLTAIGDYRNIVLNWSNPSSIDLDHIEVLASKTNDSLSASVIAKITGTTFTHNGLDDDVTWFYWVRAVNKRGMQSQLNSNLGTSATTKDVLSFLENKITESELGQDLLSEIDSKANKESVDNAINEIQTSVNQALLEAQSTIEEVSNNAEQAIESANQAIEDTQNTISELSNNTQKAISDTNKSIADAKKELQDSLTQAEQQIAETNTRAEELVNEALAQAKDTIDGVKSELVDGIAKEATDRTAAITQEARARADAILNEKNERVASIESTQTVIQSNYDSLAQMISQVSAGTGEQFDSAKIWYFDKSIEGWVGASNSDVPTWAEGGLIRPADKTPAAVASPDGLGIDGDKYNFIKLRVKKVGSPTWAGKLWVLSPTTSGWESAQTTSIKEPDYDADGIATFNISDIPNMGEIRRFRIDLAKSQTAKDYFLIDYIAVGRPTPGASVGMVEEERTARANADAANAAARETLAVQLRGGYTGTDASKISSGLIHSVRESLVEADKAESSARQALETKVDNSVSNIETELSTLNTKTTSQATQITNLRSDLNTQNTNLNNKINAKADASALTAVTTRVTAAEGNIANQSAAVTQLNNSVSMLVNDVKTASDNPDNLLSNASFERALSDWDISGTKSAWSDLNAVNPVSGVKIARYLSPKAAIGSTTNNAQLSQTVKLVEGNTYSITCWYRHENGSVLSDANNHKLRIASSANVLLATTLFDVTKTTWTKSSLTWKSTVTGDHLICIYASLNSGALYVDDVVVEDVTDTKQIAANASAISGLTSTVTQQGGSITSQGSQITQLKNDLTATNANVNKKADATALQSLKNTVTEQGNNLASQSNSLTQLSNSLETTNRNADAAARIVGNMLANPSFERGFESYSTPAGFMSIVDAITPNYGSKILSCGVGQGTLSQSLHVVQGRTYRIGVFVRRSADAVVNSQSNNKLRIGSSSLLKEVLITTADTPTGSTWKEISGLWKSVETGKVTVSIYSSLSAGYQYFDDFYFQDVTDEVNISANASALSVLSTTVTQHEKTLTTQSNSITSLTSNIGTLQAQVGNPWFDGSLESYAVGAQVGNSNLAIISSTHAFSGTKSLRLRRASGDTGNSDKLLGTRSAVREKGIFRIELWAMMPSDQSPSSDWLTVVGLNVQNAAGSNSWCGAVTINEAGLGGRGKWTKFSGTCSIPTGMTRGLVWISCRGATGSGTPGYELYIDDVVITDITDASAAQESADANASALSTLTTRVTKTEGTLTSQGDAVTKLQNDLTTTNNNVNKKADSTALNTLTTRVTSNEGVLSSHSNSITQLQASLVSGSLIANGGMEKDLSLWVDSGTGSAFTYDAGEKALKTTTGSIRVANQTRIPVEPGTKLTVTFEFKSSETMSNAASDTVGVISDLSNPTEWLSSSTAWLKGITTSWQTKNIELTIPADFTNSFVYLRFAAGGWSPSASARLYIRHVVVFSSNGVAGKADASALNDLALKVTQQGNTLTSQSDSITQLKNGLTTANNNINKKADATTLQSLQNKVTEQDSSISSASTQITTLKAAVRAANAAGDDYIPNPTFDSAYDRMGLVVVETTATGVPAGCPFKYAAKLAGRDHIPGINSIAATEGDVIELSALVACGEGTATFNLYVCSADGPTGTVRAANAGGSVTAAKGATWVRTTWRWTVSTAVAEKGYFKPFLQVNQSSPFGTIWYATDWHCRNITAAAKAQSTADATASAVDTLTTRVTQQGNTLTSLGSRTTSLENGLKTTDANVAKKADATALSTLQNTVTQQGKDISAANSAITKLNSDLSTTNANVNKKADATALAALQSTVTQQGKTLTSQSSDLTQLGNSLSQTIDSVDAAKADADVSKLIVGNLLSNPSFERGKDGYTGWQAATSLLTASSPHGGTQILKVVPGSNVVSLLQKIPFTKDRTYKIGVFTRVMAGTTMKSGASGNNKLRIGDSNGPLKEIPFDPATLSTSSTWQEISGTWKATKTAVLDVSIMALLATGEQYFDDFYLVDVTDETNIATNATAISGLTSRVSTAEGKITSQSSSITKLTNDLATTNSNVNKKADATALSTLQSTVTQHGNTLTSQGNSITSLKNSLTSGSLILNGGLEVDSANWENSGTGSSYSYNASEKALVTTTPSIRIANTTRIPVEPGVKLTVTFEARFMSSGVTLTSGQVPLVGVISDRSNSTSWVVNAQGWMTGLSTSFQERTVTLNIPTSYTGGFVYLRLAQGGLSPATARVAVRNFVVMSSAGVSLKADASALKALENTVTQQGDTIKSQSTNITQLQNNLATTNANVAKKADTAALTSLQNTVTEQGKSLTSQSSSLTSLSSSVNALKRQGTNLWFDGTFESYADGQQIGNSSTGVAVSAYKYSGSRSLRVRRQTGETGNSDKQLGTWQSVRENGVFRVELWAMMPSDQSPPGGWSTIVGLQTVNASGGNGWRTAVSVTESGLGGRGKWVKFSGTCSVPAGHTRALVWISCRGTSGGAGYELYIDDVVITDITDANAAQASADANASAISTLDSKVTQQGNTLTSQSQSITSLSNDISEAQQDADAAKAIPTNMLANNSFERGFDGWSNSGWSTLAAQNPKSGKYIIQATVSSSTTCDQVVNLVSGRTYRIGAWVRKSGDMVISNTGNTKISIRNSAGPLKDITIPSTIGTAWTKISGDYKPTADATLTISLRSSLSAGYLYVDDVFCIDVTDELDIAANATAVTSLTNRVKTAEGRIETQSGLITSLNNSVTNLNNTKATVAALNALTTRVTATESSISSQSSSITSLSSALDATAYQGVGLNPNPRFDTGLQWWTYSAGTGGTIAWGANIGEDSSAGVKMTKAGTGNPVIRTNGSSDSKTSGTFELYPLQNSTGNNVGRPLIVRVRAKGVSGAMNLMVRFIEYPNSGASSYANDQTLIFTSAFSTQTAKFTAKTTTVRGRIEVFCYPANASVVVSAIVVEDNTANEAQSDGVVTANAVSVLQADVKVNKKDIESQSKSITTLTNDIKGKANSSALTALESTVKTQGKDVEAHTKKLDELSSTAGDNKAKIEQQSKTVASLNNTISASWTLKVEVDSKGNKIVGGIALGADSTGTSQFLINAQRLALINNTNGTVSTPFVVDSGVTYMNAAYIKNGSITSAKVGDIQSNNFVSGKTGWKIAKDGNIQLNGNSGGNGRMIITNNYLAVYDDNNVLRVKIGLL